MSFAQGPGLSEQFWWAWSHPLHFALLKQGKWICVTATEFDLDVTPPNVHLKDRFVDVTRITSKNRQRLDSRD